MEAAEVVGEATRLMAMAAEDQQGNRFDVTKITGGRLERARLFLSEVRNELKRVTWPSQREVYATTIVVILTSVIFGLYLWSIDMLLDRGVLWIFQQFGTPR